MIIHSVEHTFFYIDPTLSDEFKDLPEYNGSSAAYPARHFPSTLEDNTIYLVRRSAVGLYSDLPTSTAGNVNFSLSSLVIMGMPKQDDEMFNQMPSDAKAAWVDVDREYAYIAYRHTREYSLIINNCRNAYLSRIRLLHQDKEGYNNGWCLSLNNSTYGCDIVIENCRFSPLNGDITNAQYCGNQCQGQLYVTTGGARANSVRMKNCVIDHWGYQTAFSFGNAQYMEFENIEVYKATVEAPTTITINVSIGTACRPIVRVHDCKFHTVFCSCESTNAHSGTFISGAVEYFHAYNLVMDAHPVVMSAPRENRFRLSPLVSFTVAGGGSILENVQIDYPQVLGRKGRVIAILRRDAEGYDSQYAQGQLGQYIHLRNININCGTPDTIIYNEANEYNDWYPWSNNEHSGLIAVGLTNMFGRQASTDFLLQNIHVDAIAGVAMNVASCMVDMDDCDVKGAVRCSQSIGKIKSIETWFPGGCFDDMDSNTLWIGKMTANRRNPSLEYNGQYALFPSYRSQILCNECNTLFMPNNYRDTNPRHNNRCVYICTSDGVTGNYTVRTAWAKAQTWSINRQGSVTHCSLKLTNETKSNQDNPLPIGGDPFMGIEMEVDEAGEYIAKIYMTTYGYNIPEEIKHKFKARITRVADGAWAFSQDGTWYDDTDSVWNEIEGGTAFRLDIPFTMDAAGKVQFSYLWNWYMQGAATYLDPFPEIVKVG